MTDEEKKRNGEGAAAEPVHNTDLAPQQVVHHMPYSPLIEQYRAEIAAKYPGHIWEDISDEEFLKTIWVL